MRTARVKLRCISCGRIFKRLWPIPYGIKYIYTGVCDTCKQKDSSNRVDK